MNHIEFKRFLGNRIRQARNKRELSQEVLAGAAEINPRYLSRIELGQAMPSTFVAWRLSRELRVPITELLEEGGLDVAGRIKLLLEERTPKEAERALRVLAELLR